MNLYSFIKPSAEVLFGLALLLIFGALLFFILRQLLKQKKPQYLPHGSFAFILVFSFLSSYIFLGLLHQQEKIYRSEIGSQLCCKKYPDIEDKMAKILNELRQDSLVQKAISLIPQKREVEDNINTYIRNRYFSEHFKNYQILFTYCSPEQNLVISKENLLISCKKFFEAKIDFRGSPSRIPGFYYMNYGIENFSFLSKIYFRNQTDSLCLYIEGGIPKIMEENAINRLCFSHHKEVCFIPPQYSFAVYQSGNLLFHQGQFRYALKDKYYTENTTNYADSLFANGIFSNKAGYNHFVKGMSNDRVLILSTPHNNRSELLHLFSIFFLLYSLIASILYLFSSKTKAFHRWKYGQRLSFTIFCIVIATLIAIGLASVIYLQNLDKRNQQNILSEKCLSALRILERKYMYTHIPENKQEENILLMQWEKELDDISDLLLIDIHLYNTDGQLMLSALQNPYTEFLSIPNMDSTILSAFRAEKNNLLLKREKLQTISYYSAYIPFRNVEGNIFAYMNMPYYSKEGEWKQNLSSLLINYLSVFVGIIIVCFLITLLLSNYITRPLKLISRSVADIKLGETNRRLSWKYEDEIGDLVKQYNTLVDELEESAKKLAQSEREQAWQEMAKQVAHEIKNPLTPIKLQMQQLLRIYHDKKEDFPERLQRFSETLLSQIDLLSDIASSFSQYTRWSKAEIENISLQECLQQSIDLFGVWEHIQIETNFNTQEIFVQADKQQLKQIFTNILKNAVQALDEKQILHKKISIRISVNESSTQIEIEDNAGGIPDTELAHIFEPHFTTKTSGSGLGLAICQRLAENIKANISIKNTSAGACFTIEIPIN